jgi:hypothetical protein
MKCKQFSPGSMTGAPLKLLESKTLMASSTVSEVLRVTGFGVMQSLTFLWLTLVGVDKNTLLTPDPPENDVTDGSSILPNSRERETKKVFMGKLMFGLDALGVGVVVSR